ncbi:MAG: cation:proton antiporter [Streptococcaceae bacterium]|jgi:monovalent cation:proton antiporter-2 (CPA2) family protein|nr:cation:proton antiporter [Streptococcaceae bacterium]
MEFIGVLVFILFTTTLAGHFSKRIGIPVVIGQLLVGIIFGTGGLNLIHPDILIHEFSEIGVILLMFLAGIESDLGLLKKYLKPGILVAGLGILLPILASLGSGLALSLNSKEALFIGIILAATSVSISAEVLKELKLIDTKEGATILGAAVIDDILTVFLVSMSISFLSGESTTNQPMSLIILEQIAYFGLIFFLVKFIAPTLIRLSKRLYATSSIIITSLFIALSMAYLADFVGLSSVIGAFFAGVAIGQLKEHQEIFRNVEALGYSTFIPVFFVSIGLELEFSKVAEQWKFILIFSLVAIFSKLFGGYLGAKLDKFPSTSALMIGAAMISRGEMALIILQLGSQVGLIQTNYYSSMVIIVLITTFISPLLLKYFALRTSE